VDASFISCSSFARSYLDAAFILSHGGKDSLWIHINGDAGWLWFSPAEDHPGFVPDGMWTGEHRDVEFLMTSGFRELTILWQQLVPLDVAYGAATEYFKTRVQPSCVKWLEL
jgi:hypothetical protein